MKKLFVIIILCAMATMAMAQSRLEIAILGDSYSTYEGFIPQQNEIWYFDRKDPNRTDVDKVEKTWWWQLCKDYGYKLGVNDSWSGSTICYTGYGDEDYTQRSFITRINNLGHPDIILIFGGTNDSWANSPLGEYKYEDIRRADLYTFRPALAYLFQQAKKYYPGTPVYFILNTELKEEINASVETICKHCNVTCIKLNAIDKQNGHPNVAGMIAIAKQVSAALRQ